MLFSGWFMVKIVRVMLVWWVVCWVAGVFLGGRF